jgi:hypothetical protein
MQCAICAGSIQPPELIDGKDVNKPGLFFHRGLQARTARAHLAHFSNLFALCDATQPVSDAANASDL